MLLNIIKTIFLPFFILLIYTGCGSTYYSNYSQSYYSPQYSYNQNAKISTKKAKIRNSKAMQRATMRPYTVLGKRYYPTYAKVGDTLYGVSSWYGPNFHSKKTSNGEIYNMYDYTAAHKTLPMNTMVRVTNLDNGKDVIIRINDRGPFVKSRIIDLSNVAAHKIDMVKKGTANVKLTILGFNAKIATTKEEKEQKQASGHFYLQVGVFGVVKSAYDLKRKFEIILDKKYKVILKDDKINNKKVKRVWIDGFRSEDEVNNFKEENNLKSAMIIAK